MTNPRVFSLSGKLIGIIETGGCARFDALDVRLVGTDADTGGVVRGFDLGKRGRNFTTGLNGVGAARVKTATARRVDRRRYIAS